MENKDTGYICVFRSIKKHWLWDDPIKLKWWLDLLLSVNFSKEIQKINIGYELLECGRGQTIKSLQNWSADWKVSKDTVRNFLELLKKDTMITTENLKKTTRITICNFDTYQTNLHAKQTQSKRKANAKQTQSDPNNKENNGNNENKVKEININFSIFWELYPSERRSNKKYCLEYWNNLTDQQREVIINKLPFYIKSVSDLKFLKQSEFFFKNKKYEDGSFLEVKIKEIELAKTDSKGRPAPSPNCTLMTNPETNEKTWIL